MDNIDLKKHIIKLLKADDRLWNEDKTELNQTLLLDLVERIDETVIGLLFQEKTLREKFFVQIKKAYVFKTRDFVFFMEEHKVDNSYTAYKNRIGLSDGKRFLKDTNDVVLDFPYKDCVLEGGQSDEEGEDTYFEYEDQKTRTVNREKITEPAGYKEKQAKRKEVFFNQVLGQDEIDRLFDAKALTGWKRYSKSGESQVKDIKRGKDGTIKENLIIKGNNLLALHSLKQEFAGKVKLIYIDPPYNTGNDGFQYNDNFNHSAWLTFMMNRLEIAKVLLRDDGLILVHCDDNEQAYLKVLLDEVYDRENFIGTLIHQRAKGGGQAKHIVKGHDYVTIFAKNAESDVRFLREKVIQGKVVDIDGISHLRNDDVVRKMFGKYDKLSGDRRCYFEELEKYKNPSQVQKIKTQIKSGEYTLEKNEFGMHTIVKYTPLSSSYSKLYSIFNALSEKGNNQIAELGLSFSNPKPEEIIKFLIGAVTTEHDIVLDYHLGSGTTAAVAHKMNRQYIGIEQMDYVETVAVERLKKVIAGEQGGISKAVDWKGGGDFIYLELAKWNQAAKEKINACKSFNELETFFDQMYEKYFLCYNLKLKEFKENVLKEAEFQKLPLDEQKRMFLTMLDLNQMYVNKSEMADAKYAISKEDQKLTAEFYGED